jgi:hypothetical protein
MDHASPPSHGLRKGVDPDPPRPPRAGQARAQLILGPSYGCTCCWLLLISTVSGGTSETYPT